jgi:hypothetical protein
MSNRAKDPAESSTQLCSIMPRLLFQLLLLQLNGVLPS